MLIYCWLLKKLYFTLLLTIGNVAEVKKLQTKELNMNSHSLTAIINTGNITESSDFVAFIQGLTRDQSEAVGRWLTLTTVKDVQMRSISPLEGVDMQIDVNYANEMADLEVLRTQSQEL